MAVRNIVVLIDGTWQNLVTDPMEERTNVALLRDMCLQINAGDAQQRIIYFEGPGTLAGEKYSGGWFGAHTKDRVDRAKNWVDVQLRKCGEDGVEPRIFIFGFSRGAFAARWLAKKVDHKIAFLGVWDTVKAAPFYIVDIDELPDSVELACHAMSIDEHRSDFNVTRIDPKPGVVFERWFVGGHGDVGGGYKERDLSNLALFWIADAAQHCGLKLDKDIGTLVPDEFFLTPPKIHDEWEEKPWWKLRGKIYRKVKKDDDMDLSVYALSNSHPDLITNQYAKLNIQSHPERRGGTMIA